MRSIPRKDFSFRFALFRGRSPLLTESRLMSLPRPTSMFQFRRFPSCTDGFSTGYQSMNSGEFPHSEISGSKDVCSSPKLIAAYHVFHRLPVPRHSPCALCSLTVVYLSINISYFRFSICQRDFTIYCRTCVLQFRLVKL